MKYFVCAALLVTAGNVMANEVGGEAEKLAKKKARAIEKVELKETMLAEFKGCISSASSMEQFKDCKQKKKAVRAALKEKYKKKK